MANITVKGPEGLSVQFPEGTSSDVINKVMTEAYNKMIGATQQPQTQAEIGRDVIGRVGVGQGLMMGFGDEIAAALRSTEYTGGGEKRRVRGQEHKRRSLRMNKLLQKNALL